MKQLLRHLSALFVLALLSPALTPAGESAPGAMAPGQQSGAIGAAQESGQVVPGKYIVVLKSSSSIGATKRSAARAAVAVDNVRSVAASVYAAPDGVFGTILEGFAGTLTGQQVEDLRNNPAVDYIERDLTIKLTAQTTPWGISHVKAPQAHARGARGIGVQVGVIDDGIDYTHPDLAGVYAGGWNIIDGGANPFGGSHGTHVTGTIAAIDNTIGVIGVAPSVSIHMYKIFGSARGIPTTWGHFIMALNRAVAEGMDVVNMSLGGTGTLDAVRTSVVNAHAAGVILVASAGNQWGAEVLYPARYPEVIAVSAIDRFNNLANFSSRGLTVELTAPGVDVLSTWPGGGYLRLPGTSMAAPHVTGVVALMLSSGQFATPAELRARLTSTATDLGLPGRDLSFGHGLVNADAALGAAVPAPPVAGFTFTPDVGCLPLVVSFTDVSSNTPTAWLWDFGDGSSSTLKSPIHTYAANGSYSVTLTASNAEGSDVLSVTNAITVGGLPECEPVHAFFIAVGDETGGPVTGCSPTTITFQDYSWPNPTAWSWDFGDGGTSTLQNPSHEYAANGIYDVTLTATNLFGVDTKTLAGYIVIGGPACAAPVVEFTASSTSGCTPFAAAFTPADMFAVSMLWDFGDGATSTLRNPTHTYAVRGIYNVTLTATNADGVSSLTKPNYIAVQQTPIVDFSASQTAGFPPMTVTFTDLSTDNPTNWFWDFGDFGTSALESPTVVFDKPGDYKVMLTATNACGSVTALKEAYILVQEGQGGGCATPVSAFSGTPTTGTAPLTVSFTDQSTNAPFAWSWDFGDLAQDNVQNPTHTYTDPGTYNVSLTTGNDCGENTVTQTGYVVVSAPGCTVPPVAGFAGTPTVGDAPLTVSFNDQSSNTPTGWSWSFGDGGVSSVQNPSHVYTIAGTYTVSVTASNACGSNQVTQVNYVTVNTAPPCNAPVAGFAGAPTTGAAPLTVNFTDQTTNTPTGWSWDFGDGGTSTAQNPSHVYSAGGIFSVSLTASNACGTNQSVMTGYVTVTGGCSGPPVADFTGAPTQGTAPMTVDFTDMSTGAPDTWFWDFGDDGSSTLQNPSHYYSKPGDFKVILISSNGCGANEVVKEKFVMAAEGMEGQSLDLNKPLSFELEQNYPNPFNPMTKIGFTLPSASHVKLDVYNMAGQKVATLVDGQMGAGQHAVEWDASQQPSGIYIYRFSAGAIVEARKMVLLK
ncbi:MAG: PKD domain-containing protein [Candidatus Zixiibacteriota bacterium]